MFINSDLYKQNVLEVIKSVPSWKTLNNTKMLLVGGSGLIGTFLCDVVMMINESEISYIELFVLCRDKNKAHNRFASYIDNDRFHIVEADINKAKDIENINIEFDYIIDAASNTHPDLYRKKPIETILSNVWGTYNLLYNLKFSKKSRFLFCSSVEIYGDARCDQDNFDEKYCGYIDCNTLRAGYPESKRAGEALCQAFIEEKSRNIVIARLSRVFGPTMQIEDSRAIGQFLRKGLSKESIVLKSQGNQVYSYTYVSDAVSAIFYILINGVSGEAYNIVGMKSDVSLKDLADIIAKICEVDLVYGKANSSEAKGYSTAQRAVLDDSKLRCLGWRPSVSVDDGIKYTIDLMNERLNGAIQWNKI